MSKNDTVAVVHNAYLCEVCVFLSLTRIKSTQTASWPLQIFRSSVTQLVDWHD